MVKSSGIKDYTKFKPFLIVALACIGVYVGDSIAGFEGSMISFFGILGYYLFI